MSSSGVVTEQSRLAKSPAKDLTPRVLAELSWESGKAAESLAQIFQYASDEAHATIAWYLRAKRPKQLAAQALRALAILAGAAAGVIPILTQMYTLNGSPIIAPAWASVALAAAATLIALDRFFGFSASWMRYVAAELRIRKRLQEFQIDWALEQASWKDAEPGSHQVQRLLTRCKTFMAEVNAIVQDETNVWIQEFEKALVQVDEAVRAGADASQLGGVTVEVSNGRECEQGWYLSIDGGPPHACVGNSAAVRDLAAGIHTVRADGSIDGKPRHAETLASISAGAIASAQLTLS